MIDFTTMPRKNKAYAGANGGKIAIVYQGAQYMLKFPSVATRNQALSYTNSCISEYIGCQIFHLLGIPVQETLLGVYLVKGKEKIVVACKDFTSYGVVLQDFVSLKNQMIDSERNGYGTELWEILSTLETQTVVDPVELERRFWDMFIVDALIGNWDRHNGNWGFLYDTQTDQVELAPVYDCGSCLYPQDDEELIRGILHQPSELNHRVFEVPTSAIMEHGKRINYYRMISSLQYPGCNEALVRIVPRISMEQIAAMITAIPCITPLQKEFYLTMLQQRKERILDYSLQKLQTRHKSKPTPKKERGSR